MLLRSIAWDERLAQLSLASEYLYLKAIPWQDDYGRMLGRPAHFRGTVCPARAEREPWDDDVLESLMAEWLQTTDEDGHLRPLVKWGAARGIWVVEFPGFAKTQKLRRRQPSSLPTLGLTLFSAEAHTRARAKRSEEKGREEKDPPGAYAPGPPCNRGGGDDAAMAAPEPEQSQPVPTAVLEAAPEAQAGPEAARTNDEAPMPAVTPATMPEEAATMPADVSEVYEFWRDRRQRSHGRYDRISKLRRQKIETRLRRDGFSVHELKRAIAAVDLDPWDGRQRHDDLTVILRSREQVEKFLELEERGTANGQATATGRFATYARA